MAGATLLLTGEWGSAPGASGAGKRRAGVLSPPAFPFHRFGWMPAPPEPASPSYLPPPSNRVGKAVRVMSL